MKIILLLTQSLESPGGVGRYWPLAKALAGLGHEITLLALHHDYKNDARHEFISDGVRVKYVGQMHVRKSGNRKEYFHPLQLLWISAIATLRLTWAALSIEADVVQVCKTQPMNGLAAWIVHVIRRIPVYLDSDDYEAENNRFTSSWQQRLVAWFEDWMPSFASGMTVGTTFIGNRYRQLGFPADRILFVPNGVDRARFEILEHNELPRMIADLRDDLSITDSDRVLVYVGSMSLTSHAIDLLLEAFCQVVEQLPEAILVLVGAGEDLEKLQCLAYDLRVHKKVRFVGRVPAPRVPLYYRLAEVSTDPMRDSIPAESSLSLKLIESIVSGVPCVTANIGDRRDFVGKAGIAVAPGDASALANAVLSLFRNAELTEQMRLAAQGSRDLHWWDERVKVFFKVYHLDTATED